MKRKASIRKFSKGIWFYKKNYIRIESELGSDIRQLFIEDILRYLSAIIPAFRKPLSESALVAGFRGGTVVSSERNISKDQCLHVEGVLTGDENFKEESEVLKIPFTIDTQAGFNKLDESERTIFYELSHKVECQYKELISVCSLEELGRNPTVRFRHIEGYFEKFSLDGLISRWSKIPAVDETIVFDIHENRLRVLLSSDATKAEDQNDLYRSLTPVLARYFDLGELW